MGLSIRSTTLREVTGIEWELGSARLQRLAQHFPQPDHSAPLRSMKQHMFLCPEDIRAGADEERERWLERCQEAVGM